MGMFTSKMLYLETNLYLDAENRDHPVIARIKFDRSSQIKTILKRLDRPASRLPMNIDLGQTFWSLMGIPEWGYQRVHLVVGTDNAIHFAQAHEIGSKLPSYQSHNHNGVPIRSVSFSVDTLELIRTSTGLRAGFHTIASRMQLEKLPFYSYEHEAVADAEMVECYEQAKRNAEGSKIIGEQTKYTDESLQGAEEAGTVSESNQDDKESGSSGRVLH